MSRCVKRAFDIAASTVGLVVLAPALCALCLVVLLDRPGPIFYRGIRTGRNGVPFRIFKFRTMIPEAELVGGMSTGKNDFRVTRTGAILRRYKLDELPQLLNVLSGEMSIVGPRPEMPEYTRLYAPEESLILSVRPGITDHASLRFADLASALGERDPDRVYETVVRPVKNALRVEYVRTRTFHGDIAIILRTLARLARL